MRTVVVDASVAVKWTFPEFLEPLTDRADDLLQQYARGQIDLVVPDLFWTEITNFLWKSVRQEKIPSPRAEAALKTMLARDFQTVPSREILTEALSIAVQFDRTAYDSVYVALAVALKTELITADEHLANALAAHLPVKWLGSFRGA
jgi:predicted nucleic acid-binding protein